MSKRRRRGLEDIALVEQEVEMIVSMEEKQ